MCRNRKTRLNVILSASEESHIFRSLQKQILRRLPQDDIATQSQKLADRTVIIVRAAALKMLGRRQTPSISPT